MKSSDLQSFYVTRNASLLEVRIDAARKRVRAQIGIVRAARADGGDVMLAVRVLQNLRSGYLALLYLRYKEPEAE
ncbi:hypothetical protein D9X30_3265 [Cupriavidus sp. U2]|uniref:hypothetical protein n=1 Tax=Cupriavidus sp. U2 TaxID=2920269 RepID=UPI00129E41EC|nr:hypothetical protein [Cupriavidus sp. U2]KAI3591740.1 hypothetical protein D9X30_3265 [Cupriavidus sp. U2]